MPVVVNPKKCLDRGNCFAASACPYDAYIHNSLRHTWEVDAEKCGSCPAPCLNFCDQYAVVWVDSVLSADLLRQQFAGELTAEQAEAIRQQRKQEEAAAAEKKREEAAKKAGKPLDVTTATFRHEVLESAIPVVLDCWAEWCGPCKQVAPIFAQLATQYVGKVKFAKLDTDKEPNLARSLGIRALPTMMFIYRGRVVDAVEGAMPAATMKSWIDKVLEALQKMEQAQAQQAAAPAAAAPPANPGLVTNEAQPAPQNGQQAQAKKPKLYLP